MSIKIEGIDSLVADLKRTERRVIKRSRESVKKYAGKIAERASENAPIKDGYLENSIGILSETEQPGRYTMEIGVDSDKLGPGFTRDGFPYHVKMHDDEYNLGKRSREKRDAGHNVGPDFLNRATWEFEQQLMRELENIAKKETR